MAYAQAPKKTGLSREVLKWLQSLDLSFSPKNVRRDFSNGYLVAEIFSWYYPEDFSMHSYDNGASLAAKLSNWAQIERFFTRQHILLPKEVIDGTIHCKPGAAELLVQEIYSILTHRRVKTWPGGEVDFSDRSYQEQLPMVARSTASKAIKNNLRQSEMVAEPNISTIEAKIQAIIQRHLEYRRLERLQDPSKIAQVKGPNNERCSSLLPSGFRASCETSHKAMIERFGVKPTLGERAARMPPLGSQSTQGPDLPFDPQPDSRVSFIRSRASVHFKETDSSMSTRTLSN